MQISLRGRLDTSRDRFVIEFEGGGVVATRHLIPVEGMKEPVELTVDAQGYILGVEIPNLKKGLAHIAGVEPGKPGKPGKPAK